MSVRAFGEELEERFPDLRGATYGGARVYANGNVQTPRIALLRAMAEVLEVRADWLAFNDGEMTEVRDAVGRAIETGALPGPARLPVDAPAKNALLAAWAALVEAHGGDPGAVEGDVGPTVSGEAWKRLQAAVKAPLSALEDYTVMVEGDAFSDFVADVAMAIRRYVRQTETE